MAEVRKRRNVQSLIDGGPEEKAVLEAYATAVKKMRALDEPGPGPPTDPLSWRFQAGIHGIRNTGGNPLLKKCQHWGWYFLPWHRIYILRFERIIQHHVGDDTWSLPYWDYTSQGADKASKARRALPRPFREPIQDNELFTSQRDPVINGGEAIDPDITSAETALGSFPFALDVEDGRSTFGGAKVGPDAPSGLTLGALENGPHGFVHTAVGGQDPPGLMSAFNTAALDPIFWLHHCNIDRLWDVWMDLQRQSGHSNPNPADQVWLRQIFDFADVDGSTKSNSVESVLDTRALGYEYEPSEPFAVLADAAKVFFDEEVALTPSPELVGAMSDVPFAEPTSVRIELEPPRRERVADARAVEERWHVRVENLKGERPQAVAYAVHLNVEGAGAMEGPGVRVGLVTAFGIPEASTTDENHDGSGMTVVLDITDGVRGFEARDAWDATHAVVTIVPLGPTGEPVPGGDVRAGRISIYRG